MLILETWRWLSLIEYYVGVQADVSRTCNGSVLFNDLKPEKASKHVDLVTEAADSLVGLEHYNPALNYYLMLEGNIEKENDFLCLKIARCYISLKERSQAILFHSKGKVLFLIRMVFR
ncbi:hypothetical protein AAZV13_07G109950 [Glycine max]